MSEFEQLIITIVLGGLVGSAIGSVLGLVISIIFVLKLPKIAEWLDRQWGL